jgi:formate-dependent phosphoribosylglycinamide formyltransferase (GAR transformylase)
MSRVLAIGCGPEQVPAIQAALRDGHEVFGVDGNPSAPGVSLCNSFQLLSIHRADEVVDWARTCQIEAVIPSPIGRFLTTVGRVNDALGLRGVTEVQATACADKERFSEVLSRSGVERPWFEAFQQVEEHLTAEWLCRLPVVVKPRMGSGNRGVRVLRTEGDVALFVKNFACEEFSGGWLSEIYVEGTEYGIDGWVVAGTPTVVLCRQKELTPLPGRQVLTYVVDRDTHGPLRERVQAAIEQVVDCLGLGDVLFHADIILKPDGSVYVIEFSARPAGLLISSDMVPACLDLSFLGIGLRLALGCPPAPGAPQVKHSAVLRFLNLPAGRVTSLQTMDTAPARLHVAARIGDILNPIMTGSDVLARGWILNRGDVDGPSLHGQTMKIEQEVLNGIVIEPFAR